MFLEKKIKMILKTNNMKTTVADLMVRDREAKEVETDHSVVFSANRKLILALTAFLSTIREPTTLY